MGLCPPLGDGRRQGNAGRDTRRLSNKLKRPEYLCTWGYMLIISLLHALSLAFTVRHQLQLLRVRCCPPSDQSGSD